MFVKTSLFSFIATSIRMLSLLIVNKLFAIYSGIDGIASVGQFQNLTQLCVNLTGSGFSNAIIKFTAESDSKKDAILGAGIILSFCASFILAVFLAFNYNAIGNYIFKTEKFNDLILILSMCLTFASLNYILISYFNGTNQIKLYLKCNILGSALAIICAYLLSAIYGVRGACASLLIYQALSFLYAFKAGRIFNKICKIFIDINVTWIQLKKISTFSLSSFVAILALPTVSILIRNMIIESGGWTQAGIWESVSRLGIAYTMLFTATFGVFFLPHISRSSNIADVSIVLKKILILTVFSILTIWGAFAIFGDLIIKFVYDSKFNAVLDYINYQIAGDFFKLLGWSFGLVILGNGLTKFFILMESIFAVLYLVLAYAMHERFALYGVMFAYLISYFIYAFLGFYGVRKLYQSDR